MGGWFLKTIIMSIIQIRFRVILNSGGGYNTMFRVTYSQLYSLYSYTSTLLDISAEQQINLKSSPLYALPVDLKGLNRYKQMQTVNKQV